MHSTRRYALCFELTIFTFALRPFEYRNGNLPYFKPKKMAKEAAVYRFFLTPDRSGFASFSIFAGVANRFTGTAFDFVWYFCRGARNGMPYTQLVF